MENICFSDCGYSGRHFFLGIQLNSCSMDTNLDNSTQLFFLKFREWKIMWNATMKYLLKNSVGSSCVSSTWMTGSHPVPPQALVVWTARKKWQCIKWAWTHNSLQAKRWLWIHNWEAGFGFFYPCDISAITLLQDLEQCFCASPPTKVFQNYHSYQNFDWCLHKIL